MWVYRGGPPDKPVILFEYHPTRSGDIASIFLHGYQGIVQTDGYGGYDFLDNKKDILHVGCWVHTQRKFKDVTKAAGNKNSATGNAGSALKHVSKLYKIEKDARENGSSPQQLYAQRQSLAITRSANGTGLPIIQKTVSSGRTAIFLKTLSVLLWWAGRNGFFLIQFKAPGPAHSSKV